MCTMGLYIQVGRGGRAIVWYRVYSNTNIYNTDCQLASASCSNGYKRPAVTRNYRSWIGGRVQRAECREQSAEGRVQSAECRGQSAPSYFLDLALSLNTVR